MDGDPTNVTITALADAEQQRFPAGRVLLRFAVTSISETHRNWAASEGRDVHDGFDRLVAFDAETTGERAPDAEFIRKQPFAWRAPGIIIEVGRNAA
jgi:hypothetical protein